MQKPATEQQDAARDSSALKSTAMIRGGMDPADVEPGGFETGAPKPASLKQRYVAWSLDAACLLPLLFLLASSHMQHAIGNAGGAIESMQQALPRLMEGMLANPQPTMQMAQAWLADPVMADAAGRLRSAVSGLLLTPLVLYALLALLWSVGFESSRWQATPGKRVLGLVVADCDGRRLKTGHALQRYLASSLSWLSLNIGHAMAALPPRYLALHDRISDTRVLGARAGKHLPPWAWLWLGLQVAAALVASAWGFVQLQAAMNAAMQQVLGGL